MANIKSTVDDKTIPMDEFEIKPVAPKNIVAAQKEADKALDSLEKRRKSLVAVYRDEEKVPVTISPFYAPYLGNVARVSVNGIMVDIPANGKTYMINKTHADHVTVKIRKIDQMMARQKRASAILFERAPGELHI